MTPDDDEIRAARRTAAAHRRRRCPNRRACTACLWPWREGRTGSGRPVRGCTLRRRALDVLDAAGLLDGHGRPTDPDARPHL